MDGGNASSGGPAEKETPARGQPSVRFADQVRASNAAADAGHDDASATPRGDAAVDAAAAAVDELTATPRQRSGGSRQRPKSMHARVERTSDSEDTVRVSESTGTERQLQAPDDDHSCTAGVVAHTRRSAAAPSTNEPDAVPVRRWKSSGSPQKAGHRPRQQQDDLTTFIVGQMVHAPTVPGATADAGTRKRRSKQLTPPTTTGRDSLAVLASGGGVGGGCQRKSASSQGSDLDQTQTSDYSTETSGMDSPISSTSRLPTTRTSRLPTSASSSSALSSSAEKTTTAAAPSSSSSSYAEVTTASAGISAASGGESPTTSSPTSGRHHHHAEAAAALSHHRKYAREWMRQLRHHKEAEMHRAIVNHAAQRRDGGGQNQQSQGAVAVLERYDELNELRRARARKANRHHRQQLMDSLEEKRVETPGRTATPPNTGPEPATRKPSKSPKSSSGLVADGERRRRPSSPPPSPSALQRAAGLGMDAWDEGNACLPPPPPPPRPPPPPPPYQPPPPPPLFAAAKLSAAAAAATSSSQFHPGSGGASMPPPPLPSSSSSPRKRSVTTGEAHSLRAQRRRKPSSRRRRSKRFMADTELDVDETPTATAAAERKRVRSPPPGVGKATGRKLAVLADGDTSSSRPRQRRRPSQVQESALREQAQGARTVPCELTRDTVTRASASDASFKEPLDQWLEDATACAGQSGFLPVDSIEVADLKQTTPVGYCQADKIAAPLPSVPLPSNSLAFSPTSPQHQQQQQQLQHNLAQSRQPSQQEELSTPCQEGGGNAYLLQLSQLSVETLVTDEGASTCYPDSSTDWFSSKQPSTDSAMDAVRMSASSSADRLGDADGGSTLQPSASPLSLSRGSSPLFARLALPRDSLGFGGAPRLAGTDHGDDVAARRHQPPADSTGQLGDSLNSSGRSLFTPTPTNRRPQHDKSLDFYSASTSPSSLSEEDGHDPDDEARRGTPLSTETRRQSSGFLQRLPTIVKDRELAVSEQALRPSSVTEAAPPYDDSYKSGEEAFQEFRREFGADGFARAATERFHGDDGDCRMPPMEKAEVLLSRMLAISQCIEEEYGAQFDRAVEEVVNRNITFSAFADAARHFLTGDTMNPTKIWAVVGFSRRVVKELPSTAEVVTGYTQRLLEEEDALEYVNDSGGWGTMLKNAEVDDIEEGEEYIEEGEEYIEEGEEYIEEGEEYSDGSAGDDSFYGDGVDVGGGGDSSGASGNDLAVGMSGGYIFSRAVTDFFDGGGSSGAGRHGGRAGESVRSAPSAGSPRRARRTAAARLVHSSVSSSVDAAPPLPDDVLDEECNRAGAARPAARDAGRDTAASPGRAAPPRREASRLQALTATFSGTAEEEDEDEVAVETLADSDDVYLQQASGSSGTSRRHDAAVDGLSSSLESRYVGFGTSARIDSISNMPGFGHEAPPKKEEGSLGAYTSEDWNGLLEQLRTSLHYYPSPEEITDFLDGEATDVATDESSSMSDDTERGGESPDEIMPFTPTKRPGPVLGVLELSDDAVKQVDVADPAAAVDSFWSVVAAGMTLLGLSYMQSNN